MDICTPRYNKGIIHAFWDSNLVFQPISTTLDAIFIPTHRASHHLLRQLESIASSAQEVCLLASGKATPFLHANRNKLPSNVRTINNVPNNEMRSWFLALPSSQNPSRMAKIDYDLPLKRNFAISLSRQIGYRCICLLDDDITIYPSQIKLATSFVGSDRPIVGFYVLNYPDVSTTEHMHRIITGIPSETIPGGNCLFLNINDVVGFFPYIYNEDWLFVHMNLAYNYVYVVGEVNQKLYTPWQNLERVRFEEFGEVIITGILESSDGIKGHELFSEAYWQRVIVEREDWLDCLDSRNNDLAFAHAITAAQSALRLIDARSCAKFFAALMQDMEILPCVPNIPKLV